MATDKPDQQDNYSEENKPTVSTMASPSPENLFLPSMVLSH